MLKFFVLSHTHWDREWYQPFEVMKLRLVDLIDYLLEILEKDDTYIFHLDEQTVILEDYLSVRPEKERLLKKYIKSKNIFVGPWYLQNDFYYSSGEATIRNLHYGIEIAEKFGYVNKAGYAPDNFGIISQLPQIFNGFGIDTLLFGRGYERAYRDVDGGVRYYPRKTEFIWEGADGSKLYANFMKAWYNNAQRIPDELESALYMLKRTEEDFKDFSVTPFLLLMNGVDHLEAQDNVKDLIDRLNKELGEGSVIQTDMETYLNRLKEFLKEVPNAYVFKGELREGPDYKLLRGCASSRIYLKALNVKAQDMLEYKIEPLYSMLELFGLENVYSQDHLDYFWKNALKQLPHDNICGCSCDAVNRHMFDLYQKMEEGTGEYYKRGLEKILNHAKIDGETPSDYKISVVNTTDIPNSGLSKAQIDIPNSDGWNKFSITDANGKEIPYEIISQKQAQKDVISGLNLPGIIDVKRTEIIFDSGSINPYAVKSFLVKNGKGKVVKRNSCEKVSNGVYTVWIEDDKLCLEKGSRVIKGVLDFEDSYDCGDSYLYRNYANMPYELNYKLKSAKLTDSELYGKIELKYQIFIPEGFDFINKKRSKKLVNCTLSMVIILEKASEILKVNYTLSNKAKNHRLRVKFKTDVKAEGVYCDSPFDVVYRDGSIEHPEAMCLTYPNTSFATLQDEEKGFAVFTVGQHEVERVANDLYFTIVRATGNINADPNGRTVGGDVWIAPENQCIMDLFGEFAISLYDGDFVTAQIPNKSIQFRNQSCIFSSCDEKKFSGGRFAVQDAQLQYIYYREDRYKDVVIKDNQSAFIIKGDGIAVSCVKKAYKDNCIVVRAYNYSEKDTTAKIIFDGKIYLTDMQEEKIKLIGEKEAECKFTAKQIITFKFKRK